MNTPPVKQFYMLRHGESAANAAGIYSGQMDTPLTELGEAQAAQAAHLLQQKLQLQQRQEQVPQVIIHSHLQRARETARPIAAACRLEMIEKDIWGEQHIGIWSGRLHEDVRNMRLAGVEPPEGETNDAFISRIVRAATKTLAEYEVPLIVCHGGCFRALAAHYGLNVSGILNCLLYEFVPSQQEGRFPWDVYVYDATNGQKHIAEEFMCADSV
ncbi:MAG: histidine phosphatase family protein [Rhodospirillales bacterium]|nr:histidine phosphatase family protein [Rhodospirillales bacterium]MCB9965396.1 histidine phosphatase family protein [Rhodospirillales bacterium]MCB9973291.1 histidine phosphatase family protein [Rhodospirillales bacterium]